MTHQFNEARYCVKCGAFDVIVVAENQKLCPNYFGNYSVAYAYKNGMDILRRLQYENYNSNDGIVTNDINDLLSSN